MNTTNTQAQA
jgi:hypothetical protein